LLTVWPVREQLRPASLRQVTCHLAKLQPPPEPVDLLDLENSLKALRQTTTEVSRQQSYLADLSGRLDHQTAEIQAYLQDTGSCPLCGSPLDLGHFLEHRHV
jgi:DNA repair exonuclease SbcCD ATPase subunit